MRFQTPLLRLWLHLLLQPLQEWPLWHRLWLRAAAARQHLASGSVYGPLMPRPNTPTATSRQLGVSSPVGLPWPVQERAAGSLPPPFYPWADHSNTSEVEFSVTWLYLVFIQGKPLGMSCAVLSSPRTNRASQFLMEKEVNKAEDQAQLREGLKTATYTVCFSRHRLTWFLWTTKLAIFVFFRKGQFAQGTDRLDTSLV